MNIKFLLLVFFILISSSIAQNITDRKKDLNLEKYFNQINQSFFLDRDDSFKQAINYLKQYLADISFSPQLSSWLIHNYTFQRWNSSFWQNDSSQVYDYNQDNLLSERKVRDWIGNQWIDQCRFLYNYDQFQRKVSQLFQVYLSNSWVDSSRKNYDYNSLGLLSTETTYRWNNESWENWQLITSTYYNSNEPNQDIYQNWDNNSWVNSERTVYEYYSNSIVIRFDLWLLETWINLLRIVANYDSNGLLYEIKIQIWFFGWENLTRILFTFDNYLNILEALNQEWDFNISDWVNYSRITSTYTPENLPKTNLEERWSANSYWINYFLRTYNYDGFQNHNETIGQSWNGNGWSNSEREVFDFIVSVEDQSTANLNDYELIGNYPNPFNPITTIQFHIPELSNVTLKVYNSIGEEMGVLVNEELLPGDYKIKWNAEGVNSGVYFYQLKANDPSTGSGQSFVETRKMILLK